MVCVCACETVRTQLREMRDTLSLAEHAKHQLSGTFDTLSLAGHRVHVRMCARDTVRGYILRFSPFSYFSDHSV